MLLRTGNVLIFLAVCLKMGKSEVNPMSFLTKILMPVRVPKRNVKILPTSVSMFYFMSAHSKQTIKKSGTFVLLEI